MSFDSKKKSSKNTASSAELRQKMKKIQGSLEQLDKDEKKKLAKLEAKRTAEIDQLTAKLTGIEDSVAQHSTALESRHKESAELQSRRNELDQGIALLLEQRTKAHGEIAARLKVLKQLEALVPGPAGQSGELGSSAGGASLSVPGALPGGAVDGPSSSGPPSAATVVRKSNMYDLDSFSSTHPIGGSRDALRRWNRHKRLRKGGAAGRRGSSPSGRASGAASSRALRHHRGAGGKRRKRSRRDDGKPRRQGYTDQMVDGDGDNYDEDDGFDEESRSDDEQFGADETKAYEREWRASVAANLPFDALGELESEQMPWLANDSEKLQTYLMARNFVLSQWHDDVRRWLTLQRAGEGIQERYLSYIRMAYRFLRRFGYINFGLCEPAPASNSDAQSVVVVGAGFAGLTAACQLRSLGYQVIVLEAAERPGGRCFTDYAFGDADQKTGVDLGASIITGTEGNPLSMLVKQLNTETYVIKEACPMYDIDGSPIVDDLDDKAHKLFNLCLDAASRMKLSYGNVGLGKVVGALCGIAERPGDDRNGVSNDRELVESAVSAAKAAQQADVEGDGETIAAGGDGGDKKQKFVDFEAPRSAVEERMLQWHWANMEYACATDLDKVSLAHWDQDDPYDLGGFHCLLPTGYSSIIEALASRLDVRYKSPVTAIRRYGAAESGDIEVVYQHRGMEKVLKANRCLVTVSLGVLKAGLIQFDPPLPMAKQVSVERLGFGLLNKVVIQYDRVFWDPTDYFGHASGVGVQRGQYYIFWNLEPVARKPVVIALCAGQAAHDLEPRSDDVIVAEVHAALRTIYGTGIPDPVRSRVTRWKANKWIQGSYSFIAAGATGRDVRQLAEPVGNLFFAGEATSHDHPATTTGAIFTGMRQAGYIDKSFRG